MKTILTLFIFIVSSSFVSAQYIENKLNIGFGVGINLPVSPAYYTEEGFVYQSYWGNTSYAPQYTFMAEYKARKNISFEFVYFRDNYFKWNEAVENFILDSPASDVQNVAVKIRYYPLLIQMGSGYNRVGFVTGPVLGSQKLYWKQIDSNVEFSNDQSEVTSEKNPINGVMVGLSMVNENDNWDGFRVDVTYRYSRNNSSFYLDHVYQTFNLSFVYYLKFFKNKYYQYE